MIFKDINGYKGKYAISSCGVVVSKKRNNDIILNQYIKKGYAYVYLYNNKKRKFYSVHRLVIETYKRKSKETVNHINGNKLDNNINNLEYCSHKDNIIHAYKNNLMPKSKPRLKKTDVYKIKYNETMSYKKIAEKYNVASETISRIKRGITWKNI